MINLETYYIFPNVDSSNDIFRYSMDKGKTWKLIEIPEDSNELSQINTDVAILIRSKGDYDIVNQACVTFFAGGPI